MTGDVQTKDGKFLLTRLGNFVLNFVFRSKISLRALTLFTRSKIQKASTITVILYTQSNPVLKCILPEDHG
jgi:hypothetical protein